MDVNSGWPERIFDGFCIMSWYCYVYGVVYFSIVIRILMCTLRALEKPPSSAPMSAKAKTPCQRFTTYFMGESLYDDRKSDYWGADYWYPTILGTLELILYPILMRIGAWEPIGAWIGFKTIAQWDQWKQSRNSFNRYLIGNLFVLAFGYLLARAFVGFAPHYGYLLLR